MEHAAAARARTQDVADARTNLAGLRRRYCLRRCLDLLQFGWGLAVPAFYLSAWLILLLARLVSSAPPWAVAFAPLMALMLHPLVMAGLSHLTVRCSRRAGHASACRGQEAGETDNWGDYARRAVTFDAGSARCNRARPMLFWLSYACLLLVPVLVVLKLEQVISGPWPAVFVPLWLLMCPLLCALPWTGTCPSLVEAGMRNRACAFISVGVTPSTAQGPIKVLSYRGHNTTGRGRNAGSQ
jgi:hypothetical protein